MVELEENVRLPEWIPFLNLTANEIKAFPKIFKGLITIVPPFYLGLCGMLGLMARLQSRPMVTTTMLNWVGVAWELGERSFYCLSSNSKNRTWCFPVRTLKNFSYKPHSHCFAEVRTPGIWEKRTNCGFGGGSPGCFVTLSWFHQECATFAVTITSEGEGRLFLGIF